MITLAEVKESLRTFIAETSLYPPEKVKYETLIFEEGIFDSLGFLALVRPFTPFIKSSSYGK